MKHILPLLCITATLTACNGQKNRNEDWSEARQEMETNAQVYLKDARTALGRKEYEAARNAVKQLRETCDLAFNAREEGILLMDSIDLQEALAGMVVLDSLVQARPEAKDTLREKLEEQNQKVKFFRRKLEHDKAANEQKKAKEVKA